MIWSCIYFSCIPDEKIYNFQVLIRSICLWTCHCAAGGAFFSDAPTKSRCTPTLSNTHTQTHTPSTHIFAGLRTHTSHSSEEFDLSRLSAFADRDTSTSQDSPPSWQASPWHPSDHCGAIASAPHISISPLFFPHISSIFVKIYISEQSGVLPTHTHTSQVLADKLWEKGTSPFCVSVGLKWDTVMSSVHDASLMGVWLFSYCSSHIMVQWLLIQVLMVPLGVCEGEHS